MNETTKQVKKLPPIKLRVRVKKSRVVRGVYEDGQNHEYRCVVGHALHAAVLPADDMSFPALGVRLGVPITRNTLEPLIQANNAMPRDYKRCAAEGRKLGIAFTFVD